MPRTNESKPGSRLDKLSSRLAAGLLLGPTALMGTACNTIGDTPEQPVATAENPTSTEQEKPVLEQLELNQEFQYIPTTFPVEGNLEDRTTEELSRLAGYWETSEVDDEKVIDGLLTSATYYADNVVWALEEVATHHDLNTVDIDHLLRQLEFRYFTDSPDSEVATEIREFMVNSYFEQEKIANDLNAAGELIPVELFAQICPTIFDENVLDYTMCSPTDGKPFMGDKAGPSSLFDGEVKDSSINEEANVYLTVDVRNTRLPGDSGPETHSTASIDLPNTTIAKGDDNQIIFINKESKSVLVSY